MCVYICVWGGGGGGEGAGGGASAACDTFVSAVTVRDD